MQILSIQIIIGLSGGFINVYAQCYRIAISVVRNLEILEILCMFAIDMTDSHDVEDSFYKLL